MDFSSLSNRTICSQIPILLNQVSKETTAKGHFVHISETPAVLWKTVVFWHSGNKNGLPWQSRLVILLQLDFLDCQLCYLELGCLLWLPPRLKAIQSKNHFMELLNNQNYLHKKTPNKFGHMNKNKRKLKLKKTFKCILFWRYSILCTESQVHCRLRSDWHSIRYIIGRAK